MSAAARDCQRVTMNEFDAKIIAIANKAVKAAQDENRRLGIANVYSINGTIVWQLKRKQILQLRQQNAALFWGRGALFFSFLISGDRPHDFAGTDPVFPQVILKYSPITS